MSCSCIDKLESEIRGMFSVPENDFVTILNTYSQCDPFGNMECRHFGGVAKIYKKGIGDELKSVKVKFSYCPICGKKY